MSIIDANLSVKMYHKFIWDDQRFIKIYEK